MTAVSVYCPMQAVSIFAGSKALDDVGQFTKYVLWAVSEGYSSQEMAEAICLDSFIVEDELTYLLRIGFIHEKEGKYEASETGKGYISLVKAIDEFNDRNILAQVNMFFGNIADAVEDRVQNPAKDTCLPSKVSRYLIRNSNYPPLKEYVDSKFGDLFDDLRPEFRNSLYFYLVPKPDERYYRKYSLDAIPSAEDIYEDVGEPMVILKREVLTGRFEYRDDRLMNCRTVLDTLDKLSQFDLDRNLLSAHAAELLQWHVEETNLNNKNSQQVFFDKATGQRLDVIPEYHPVKAYLKPLKISQCGIAHSAKEYSVEEIVCGVRYQRNFNFSCVKVIYQPIPLSLFKEVSSNES